MVAVTTIRIDTKTRELLFQVKIQIMEELQKDGVFVEPTMDDIIRRVAGAYLKDRSVKSGSRGR